MQCQRKPDVTEGINPEPGYNLVALDTRYLRNWLVSEPTLLPFGKKPVTGVRSTYGKTGPAEIPDSSIRWSPIKAESRGIISRQKLFRNSSAEIPCQPLHD